MAGAQNNLQIALLFGCDLCLKFVLLWKSIATVFQSFLVNIHGLLSRNMLKFTRVYKKQAVL